MWLSVYLQSPDLWPPSLISWYPILLQKCWICFAPKWRRAALPSSISRKQKSLAGPPPPRRWREAHYKALAQFWLNHCSSWRVLCSVSAAAGRLSRHPCDCLECRQLGTREGGIHCWMKMYKSVFISQRTFYSSESSLGVLQLAPSIDHQISAMFSILERYPELFN